VRSTIDPILDSSDAWSVSMERGTPYRINLTTPSDCLSLSIYRPRTYSFALTEPVEAYRCGGYVVFTPGIDGGGLYSLVVRARGTAPVKRSYRLQVAPSSADDGAPGIKLANGQSVSGTIFGRGIDIVDVYRLAVPRANELTTVDLRLKPNVGLDLVVLKESGGRVTCACDGPGSQMLRENLPPAWYYLLVRSRDKSGGKYRLQALVRDVTTTSIAVNGTSSVEVLPETSVQLTVQVTSASHGGPVQIEIDHRDLLFGWQFSSVVAASVDASGAFATDWTPPLVGHWRARARFAGTPFSSLSASGYVYVHVAEPLE
jgi:hypothetical protein